MLFDLSRVSNYTEPMINQRIYLDNSATSFPKPPEVAEAMADFAHNVGASAGRGFYQESIRTGEIIRQARKRIARLIHCDQPDNIVMTFNCTDALSLAIKGLVTMQSAHVITTRMDHNSVLRPLEALKQQLGLEVTYIQADSRGVIDPQDFRQAIQPNTVLIATLHGSNVCGSIVDIAAVGAIANEHDIAFLVDAAQTIGHLPIDVSQIGVDMMAFPGHKGLMGPQGTGVLYIRPGFEHRLRPLREGGTGSKSELPIQPDFMPDRFESGSHNAIGIAGLNAALGFLLEQDFDTIVAREQKLYQSFLAETNDIEGLTVYGPKNPDERIGVFSITLEGHKPLELSKTLEEQFALLTRPGLHCAPFAHQAIGTFDSGGTTRLSTGHFTTQEQITQATNALKQLTQSKVAQ
jgi:cysteine desulfurase/selenocysteine lyase